MNFAPCALAAVLAGTVAGCAHRYNYAYDPNYAYASEYSSYPTRDSYSHSPSREHYYTSKWDYYRHYNGSDHPGPEQNP